MAERVVHALETVKVDKQNGERLVLRERLQRLFPEQKAIRKISERVVPRHVHDLRLGVVPLGDILIGRDPAVIRGRPVNRRDNPAIGELI